MKTVAIIQSCYIPWKGFFDIIRACDEFILYDDAQYTRRDWRNRNRIKTAQGLHWLTIPVDVKGKYLQKICETKIHDTAWVNTHLNSLEHAYKRAPFYQQYADSVRQLYEQAADESSLSKVNYLFIMGINKILGITTPVSWSMDYEITGDKTEALVSLCRGAKAQRYISGPSAQGYIEPALFEQAGIALQYVDYSQYPSYPQQYGEFEHGVSILDLLFNTGDNATSYMKILS